jgi:hypothetical protein
LILIHGVDRCTDTLKSGFDGWKNRWL